MLSITGLSVAVTPAVDVVEAAAAAAAEAAAAAAVAAATARAGIPESLRLGVMGVAKGGNAMPASVVNGGGGGGGGGVVRGTAIMFFTSLFMPNKRAPAMAMFSPEKGRKEEH